MTIDLLDRPVTAWVAVGILPERRDDDVFGRIETDDAVCKVFRPKSAIRPKTA